MAVLVHHVLGDEPTRFETNVIQEQAGTLTVLQYQGGPFLALYAPGAWLAVELVADG